MINLPLHEKSICMYCEEERLRRNGTEVSLLLDMSNLLLASVKPRDILDGFLVKVLAYLNLDAGCIYLMDENGQLLTLAACQGLESKGFETIKAGEGFSGKAIRTRSFTAHCVSVFEDRERAALPAGRGFKVVFSFPLMVADKVIGVVILALKRVFMLSRERVDLLMALGHQAATAVDHARLYENLEKKEKMVEVFARSIFHDLKSPAVGAYGLARLLEQRYGGVLDEKGRRICEGILEATGEIVALLDTLKTYIKVKETKLDIQQVDVKQVIRDVHDEFSCQLDERHIKWSESEHVPSVRADRLCLVRIFQNLVENALKYGGKDLSEIRIGHRDDGSFHIFSVSDDGATVKKEDSERIFELFQRENKSEGVEGAGLGLPIVREIARQHQGTAWVEPRPARGVAFCISISKRL